MNHSLSSVLRGALLAGLVCLAWAVPSWGASNNIARPPGNPISWVDTSLKGSEKYVLRIDGKPFYPTEIQIRLDKLRYWWGFNAAAREAVVAQAAHDGFNAVALPIQWYEVEPAKDKFDWKILDEYLNLARKYDLKVELLWFSQNSGGRVQWLGSPANPIHLRTPDYILSSPGAGSPQTTSDYTIRRDISNYTLDLTDDKLKRREMQVLARVMDHLADWDASAGSPHTVVGIQLGNEVRSMPDSDKTFNDNSAFPASVIVSYMSSLGEVVKKSRYVVWTRLNCVPVDANSRIDANELLRVRNGTGVDFVATDLYGYPASTVRTILPYSPDNYRMVAEAGADIPQAPQFQLAALAGDAAYIYYEMLGPDDHGIYVRVGAMGFKPRGAYADVIRTTNRLLNSDMTDIALKSQGHSLYVHNWTGSSMEESIGVRGVSFTPGTPNSQAISIARNRHEIILMNTLGGTFALPPSLHVMNATYGSFDAKGNWVAEGPMQYSQTRITPAAGATVRLSLSQ